MINNSWIQTSGTPIIIIPKEYIKKWNGINGDYERACKLSLGDYISVIHLNNAEGLVLGDESMLTSHCQISQYNCIIRWIFAPSLHYVKNILEQIELDKIPIIERLSTKIMPGRLFMFDSIEVFSNQIEHIEIDNDIIVTEIITRKYVDLQKQTSLIIHQFCY